MRQLGKENREKVGQMNPLPATNLYRRNPFKILLIAPERLNPEAYQWHDSRRVLGSSNLPTTMASSLNFFRVRTFSTALAMFSLGLVATAQNATSNTDPFEQMRTNAGEEIWGRFRTDNWNGGVSPYNPFGTDISDHFSTRVIIIPPLPPTLGEELPLGGFAGSGNLPATHLSREIFYGPYATLVGRNQVTAKESSRVYAYQGARDSLVREIEKRLEELHDAPPAARRTALVELASQQDTRMQALEAEAEAIRRELESVDAKYYFIGPPRFGKTRFDGSIEESLRLIKAVYDFTGLSPEQRQLLPEIAYDRGRQEKPEKPASKGVQGDLIFFLPGTARLRLPPLLTPSLETKIQSFIAAKEDLKTELRNAVLQDNDFSANQRAQRLTALAAAQAPRFAALDTLAEEIRAELAAYGWFDQSGQSDLPADLTQRVGDFYARKVKAQREVLARLRELRTEFPRAQFDIARQGAGLAIVRIGPNPKSVAGLAEFNASLASRYTAFANESEILRHDIQRYTESNPNRVARTVDQLAADFARAYSARANWNRYRRYFQAVLEPGLSPVQRRLLFQSAAEELDQTGRPL